MHDHVSLSPRLLIVHQSSHMSTRRFCRQVDAELLTMLRRMSPERPYAMAEISSIRQTCFKDMEVLLSESLRAAMDSLDEEQGAQSQPPVEQAVTFHFLLAHLCEYSSLGFDSLEVLNAKDPMPPRSKFYIKLFLKITAQIGINPVPFLASCLTTETMSCLLRGTSEAPKARM